EPGLDPITEDRFRRRGHGRRGLSAAEDDHSSHAVEVDMARWRAEDGAVASERGAYEGIDVTGGERRLPDSQRRLTVRHGRPRRRAKEESRRARWDRPGRPAP